MPLERSHPVDWVALRRVSMEALDTLNLVLSLSVAMRAGFDANGVVDEDLDDHRNALILALNGKLSMIVESLERDDIPF